MPKLLLACVFLFAFFCLLCGPSLFVAIRLRRRGDARALPALRGLWLAQLILACGLIFAAEYAGDRFGWTNPIGYVLAIVIGVGIGGAALFGLWRLLLRSYAAR
jgi:hypothetical protein